MIACNTFMVFSFDFNIVSHFTHTKYLLYLVFFVILGFLLAFPHKTAFSSHIKLNATIYIYYGLSIAFIKLIINCFNNCCSLNHTRKKKKESSLDYLATFNIPKNLLFRIFDTKMKIKWNIELNTLAPIDQQKTMYQTGSGMANSNGMAVPSNESTDIAAFHAKQRLTQSTPGSPQDHARPTSIEVVGSAESLVGRVIHNPLIYYRFYKWTLLTVFLFLVCSDSLI